MKAKILALIIIGYSLVMTACVSTGYDDMTMTKLERKEDAIEKFSEENELTKFERKKEDTEIPSEQSELVNVGMDSQADDDTSYGEQYYDEETKVCKRINYYNSYNELNNYEIPEYVDGVEVGGTLYSSDGKAYQTYKYEYDEYWNMIKETRFNTDGSEYYRNEYDYDEYGNKERLRFSSYGIIHYYYEYEYDEKGNCNLEVRYDTYGTKQLHYVNEYDSYNRKIKSKIYNDYSNNMTHWVEYEYDEWDNCINEIWYEADGTLYQRIERIYE